MSAAPDRWAYFKDQEDGSWMAVIVGHTDRCPKGSGVAEVLDANVLKSHREAQNWAASIIGPLGDPIYVAPECRH